MSPMPSSLIAGLWLAFAPALTGAVVSPLRFLAPTTPHAAAAAAEHPTSLLALSDEELVKRIETGLDSLGSLSIGSPGSGLLFNAVSLWAGPRWEIAPTAATCGTAETIDAIETAINTVYELFPETDPIVIGDISDCDGGRLKRHESHQMGRDVDFGFYYNTGKATWFAPGTSANLDLPRNWALVRALVVRTDVEKILLDTRIQKLLHRYALSIGEDPAWLERVFQCARGARDTIVRHVVGHRTHYHVRFYNAVAQELGRRAHPLLVQLHLVEPPVFSVRHLVRRGQTLGHLAARYGTTQQAIMRANGLRTTRLRAGRSYRIPVRGTTAPVTQPIVVPQRTLPSETPEAMAAITW
jgi:penicillin-insensitive murein endopeptidase